MFGDNPYFETVYHKNKFLIKERRRQLASLLAKDSKVSQAALAQALGVDQSTISDDIRVLKQQSQQFIYDLAKGDLAYYYKQSIDGVDSALSEAWKIYSKNDDNDFFNSTKLKLMALKIIVQANEAKYKLLSDAPAVMSLKSLEDRLNRIEQSNQKPIA